MLARPISSKKLNAQGLQARMPALPWRGWACLHGFVRCLLVKFLPRSSMRKACRQGCLRSHGLLNLPEFLQHFANLFVMALLVITDKRNGRYAIDFTQEGMFEYQLSETLVTVSGAELFQTVSSAVEVLDCCVLLENHDRIYSLGSFHAQQPG